MFCQYLGVLGLVLVCLTVGLVLSSRSRTQVTAGVRRHPYVYMYDLYMKTYVLCIYIDDVK